MIPERLNSRKQRQLARQGGHARRRATRREDAIEYNAALDQMRAEQEEARRYAEEEGAQRAAIIKSCLLAPTLDHADVCNLLTALGFTHIDELIQQLKEEALAEAIDALAEAVAQEEADHLSAAEDAEAAELEAMIDADEAQMAGADLPEEEEEEPDESDGGWRP